MYLKLTFFLSNKIEENLFQCESRTMFCFSQAHNPTLKNWLEFLPFYIFVPYYLVAKFASHFFEINYWTSRVVVVHALLMTIMEFTKAKFLFRSGLRYAFVSLHNFLCSFTNTIASEESLYFHR